MKDFFGVNYKIDSVNEDIGEKLDRVCQYVSCVGVGYSNISKPIT